ncbi:MAG: FAD/NAD(P)-binding protein [bacterium]
METDLPTTTLVQSGKEAVNPYLPEMATITYVKEETPQIRTIHLKLNDSEKMMNLSFIPGQVAQVSVFGVGESTFVINSSPEEKEYLQFSIMKVGNVTGAIHGLSVGDQVGVRAPLGNGFDLKFLKGKNIVLVAGGLGLAPLRPLLLHIMSRRDEFGQVTLVYGARSPGDLCYREEVKKWQKEALIKVVLTIDAPADGWEYQVGFVPTALEETAPSAENAVAITCGPPIMIKFVLVGLEKLGFKHEHILTTLERRMKCGIGICGRCNIGSKYVCVDGPVFSMRELNELPPEL